MYVRFAGGEGTGFLIWTTTPWTLPANLAVAVHPRMEYGPLTRSPARTRRGSPRPSPGRSPRSGEGRAARADACGQGRGAARPHLHAPLPRSRGPCRRRRIRHRPKTAPAWFTPRPGTAPRTTRRGSRRAWTSTGPVLPDGTYDGSVPDWLKGKSIWDANGEIVERLRGDGVLYFDERFHPQLPARLAGQAAGDLPRHRAVVLRGGQARGGPAGGQDAARGGARGRGGAGGVPAGVGPQPPARDAREPAGLVPLHGSGAGACRSRRSSTPPASRC